VTTATRPGEESVVELATIEVRPPESPTAPGPGRTRIAAAWFGVVAAALVFVLLLIFILQNTRSVKITYFTLSGTIPVGVAFLFAAIGGVLLAGLAASLRIWQLRRRLTHGGKLGPG
jgi:uncharacterized integral membrane protein